MVFSLDKRRLREVFITLYNWLKEQCGQVGLASSTTKLFRTNINRLKVHHGRYSFEYQERFLH